MPLTRPMFGSWLTRCAICSRSARACGVRRSRGDWMRMYSGTAWLTGKWRSSAAYPTELGADGPSGLAIVVVVAHQARAAGEDDQHEQAGNQMGLRPPHDANPRTPPEPSGEFAPRLDPAARPGQHQNGGQQRHRGEVCHPDPDRARHTDRGEHAHPGEADPEEGDSHRGGGCGDHLADRDQRPPHRVVEICALPQIVVIAADQEDRVIRSRARDHRAQKDDGLVRNAQSEEFGDSGHHGLCDHQGRPDRRQRQQHGDRVAVHHQQNEEHQDADRDLDRQAILFAGDGEVGDGGRGSGDVHCQWAVGATLCLTRSATRL